MSRAHALQERVAAATEADAEARRIADLYPSKPPISSVPTRPQFGWPDCTPSIGLAQEHVEQRQTIVC